MKLGQVSDEEKLALKKIFGDLWSIIIEEVNRNIDEDPEMNSVLKALLQSEGMKVSKREIQQRHLVINSDLSPAQRIMRAAVVMLNKFYATKNGDKKKTLPIRWGLRRRKGIRKMARKNQNDISELMAARSGPIVMRVKRQNSDQDYYDDDFEYYDDEGVASDDEDDNDISFGINSRQYLSNDYDDPSINELIALAEKHRMRRQREEMINDEYVVDQPEY